MDKKTDMKQKLKFEIIFFATSIILSLINFTNNFENKYLVLIFSVFTTFMDWFDIFIFAQIANIMIKLYLNGEILNITYSLLILSILFYSIYKIFLEKKYINIWYNNAYLKIKEMYFNSIFEGHEKRNIVKIVQSDLKNMKRLGELYNIVFPAGINFY